jgi:hypothetical protein
VLCEKAATPIERHGGRIPDVVSDAYQDAMKHDLLDDGATAVLLENAATKSQRIG